MDATRRRFGSLVEWLCAAVCAAGLAAMLSVAAQEVRGVRAVVPVIAGEVPDSVVIAGVPSDVVRVPLLLLTDRREIRLGERLADVAERLGAAAQLVSESFDETTARRRITRSYNDIGIQFVLVFDGMGRNEDARVSAIFIR